MNRKEVDEIHVYLEKIEKLQLQMEEMRADLIEIYNDFLFLIPDRYYTRLDDEEGDK